MSAHPQLIFCPGVQSCRPHKAEMYAQRSMDSGARKADEYPIRYRSPRGILRRAIKADLRAIAKEGAHKVHNSSFDLCMQVVHVSSSPLCCDRHCTCFLTLTKIYEARPTLFSGLLLSFLKTTSLSNAVADSDMEQCVIGN